ncbi:c2H2-type domain-containing protein [Trichonephila clavipes]|nr:c2H2-type domain-containing protein [Trichonephila clavipes]
MRLKKERWLVEEPIRHVQEEHKMRMKEEQKCLPEERYAVAQPVAVEEKKGLFKDSSNVPSIFAEDETYEIYFQAHRFQTDAFPMGEGGIREEITVDSGRKMLIEKKGIRDIKRDFNINGYVNKHEVDTVSVKLWAQEMKNNGEICIVFFQRAGTIKE